MMYNEFFKDLAKVSLLSKEDIEYYLNLYRNGDQSARSILIHSNLKLILMVIYDQGYNYIPSIDIEDLFQEGVVDLINTIEICKNKSYLDFYRLAKGKLKTKLFDYVFSKGHFIYVPYRFSREVNRLIRKEGDISKFEFGHDKIIEKSNVSYDELSMINELLSPVELLDEKIENNNDNIINIFSNSDNINFASIDDNSIWKLLKNILTEKQYKVLLLRLGKDIYTLKNTYPKSLEECAKILNISTQAVNGLQLRAYKKIKLYLDIHKEKVKLLQKS